MLGTLSHDEQSFVGTRTWELGRRSYADWKHIVEFNMPAGAAASSPSPATETHTHTHTREQIGHDLSASARITGLCC